MEISSVHTPRSLYGPGKRVTAKPRTVYAALDLGTNNCRLLVAVPADGGFRVIDSFSRITRLGEGLHASGQLSENAIGRTVDALQICAQKLRKYKDLRARFVATEACRGARNCDSFVAMAEHRTGINLEIISAKEEAQLAVRGCRPLLKPNRKFALVFDIGGGSTEVTLVRVADNGDISQVVNSISMPWGVVRLAEEYDCGEVDRERFEAMVATISDLLVHFERRNNISDLLRDGALQMIGTSGTVTTIAGVQLGLEKYERDKVDGRLLDFETIRTIVARLCAMNLAELAGHPCIGAERADLVLPGCAIMEAILREWPVGELTVADRGLRDGILYDLIAAHHQQTHPT